MQFFPAGHIIGSAWLRVDSGGRRVVFSGDVGRAEDPVMRPPTPVTTADFVVCESTYGNRAHRPENSEDELAAIVQETAKRGGILLIPAFAVGRTQSLLYLLWKLREAKRIPSLPTFMDSPMAINATAIMRHHAKELRLSEAETRSACGAAQYVRTREGSMALDQRQGPFILLSASGMATGGRVLHHLKAMVGDSRNTVLFAGYQAAGTRGEAMLSGVSEVKIHGEYFPVRARVVRLDGLSAHADYKEIGAWLGPISPAPRRTFLVHGEQAATDALRRYLQDTLDFKVHLPTEGEQVDLTR